MQGPRTISNFENWQPSIERWTGFGAASRLGAGPIFRKASSSTNQPRTIVAAQKLASHRGGTRPRLPQASRRTSIRSSNLISTMLTSVTCGHHRRRATLAGGGPCQGHMATPLVERSSTFHTSTAAGGQRGLVNEWLAFNRGSWARSAGRWIGNGAAKMSRSSCLSRSTRRRYHRAPLAPGSVICLCPLDRQSGDMSKSISKPGHRSSRRAYLRRAGMWTGQSSDHWCHPTTQSGTHLLVAVRCRMRQCWTQSRGSSGLTSETAQRIPRKCASNTMLQNNRDLGSRGRVHRPTDAATRRQREPPGRSTVLRSGRQRATRKPPLVNRNRPQHKHGFGATVQSRQPR